MPTTGRRAARLASLGLVLAMLGPAPALPAEETPFSALAQLATALSENDSDAAMDVFDPTMSGYSDIELRVEALTAQADISCSIDVVTDRESDGTHMLDVDWYFQLQSQTDDALIERRRQRVQIEMRRLKGHWRITALSPSTILDPLAIR